MHNTRARLGRCTVAVLGKTEMWYKCWANQVYVTRATQDRYVSPGFGMAGVVSVFGATGVWCHYWLRQVCGTRARYDRCVVTELDLTNLWSQ